MIQQVWVIQQVRVVPQAPAIPQASVIPQAPVFQLVTPLAQVIQRAPAIQEVLVTQQDQQAQHVQQAKVVPQAPAPGLWWPPARPQLWLHRKFLRQRPPLIARPPRQLAGYHLRTLHPLHLLWLRAYSWWMIQMKQWMSQIHPIHRLQQRQPQSSAVQTLIKTSIKEIFYLHLLWLCLSCAVGLF